MSAFLTIKWALRSTRAEGTRVKREGPTQWEVSAESSRWLQIAKQNRTRKRAERRAELCSTRSASEDARLAQRGGDLGGQQGVPRGHAVPS
jgi:hypothetical protein